MSGLNKLFGEQLLCANVGLKVFHEAILEQETRCIHIEWKPPADGDDRLIKILEWLEGE